MSSLLVQPSELKNNILVKGLIYGQPGVGKSTIALSAPNPVMIDADQGMYRVEKRFQVPSLPLTDYQNVLHLMQSDELAPYQTIVFDTLGKLVDRIGDYVAKNNPKNRQGDGTLTMKAWGAIKLEFQNLLSLADARGKHLIFVAHEREEKDGDIRITRPDVSGSSGKDLLKDLDFVGYTEMRGGKRSISFSPSEKFYAKNSLKLPPYIEIPDTDRGNNFIQKYIIEKTVERAREEDILGQKYNNIKVSLGEIIGSIKTSDDANNALKQINDAEEIWDSARQAKKALSDKTASLGLIYNKTAQAFEGKPVESAAPAEGKAEEQAAA